MSNKWVEQSSSHRLKGHYFSEFDFMLPEFVAGNTCALAKLKKKKNETTKLVRLRFKRKHSDLFHFERQ